MSEQIFINNLLQAMAADEKLTPEIPLPELARVLFDGKPVNENDLVLKLISFREKYDLDYITILPAPGVPSHRRPPMVTFWKIKKTEELPEVIDAKNSD